jgi:CRISPR/Cas system-associated exonuclease Cas4 (RecB family)
MDVYVYILRKMKFKVSDTSYFLVCNALKTPEKFDAKLQFELTLVPYKTDTSWVESKIVEMKSILDSPDVPEINKYCEKCMYLDAGKNFI